MQKQHLFMCPFYYIDYALAQICAIPVLWQSQERQEESMGRLLSSLPGRWKLKGYFDLLKLAELDNPFHEGTVKEDCGWTIEDLFK